MTSEEERFWNEFAGPLRRAEGFSVPSPTALQAELDAIEVEPLTETQVDAIVQAAVSGQIPTTRPTIDFDWVETGYLGRISEDALQLNRNLGDADGEVDELLERQRREALKDDENRD